MNSSSQSICLPRTEVWSSASLPVPLAEVFFEFWFTVRSDTSLIIRESPSSSGKPLLYCKGADSLESGILKSPSLEMCSSLVSEINDPNSSATVCNNKTCL